MKNAIFAALAVLGISLAVGALAPAANAGNAGTNLFPASQSSSG
jgi:hypothetical protein